MTCANVVTERLEELLRDFHHEAHTRHNVERIVCARVGDLVVREASRPFEVVENDGAERMETVQPMHGRRITI